MFVYERNGNICIVFEGNLPVDVPAYAIDIDEEAKTISINGKVIEPNVETDEVPGNEPDQEQTAEEDTSVDVVDETISKNIETEEEAE